MYMLVILTLVTFLDGEQQVMTDEIPMSSLKTCQQAAEYIIAASKYPVKLTCEPIV